MLKSKNKGQKKKEQQKRIQLNTDQLIKLMQEQKEMQNGQLNGISYAKIPITNFTPEINQYLSQFKEETNLCFMKCNLQTLDGLNIPGDKIVDIKINYNNITGDALKTIAKKFPNVTTLDLRHNQISHLEDLSYLKLFQKIQFLDLSFNPVNRYQDYRKTVFSYLPHLNNLDNDELAYDSMDNSSQDGWISQQEESEEEYQLDDDEYNEESEECINKKRKKVKK